MSWIVETFVATTLLMLLVLVIRRPVARYFGPGIVYALWSLPVLRMLLPPLPGEWRFTSLIAPFTRPAENAQVIAMGLLNPDALPPQVADAVISDITVQFAGHHAALAVVPPTAIADGPNVLTLLLGLWAIGVIGFIAYHLIAHYRFCATLLEQARVRRTIAQGRVHVIETDAATGPLAFGIWRKYVAFPRDFNERYDPLERNLALAHELGHHLRGDLIANWVALVVLAFHWFNPVAWRAFRAFRADQEMACDALVLSGRAPALRHAYGCAIVKSAHGGAVSAACHLHTINELKGRLKMLSNHNRKSRGRNALGIFAATGIAAAALIGTASGGTASAAAAQVSSHMSTVVTASTTAPVAASSAVPTVSVAQSPAAPSAPVAAPTPPAPPVLSELSSGDGTAVRRVKVIRTDGKTHGVDVPEVSSIDCKAGDPAGMTSTTTTKDGKKIIVICQNRIEAAANAAAVAGVDAQRIHADAMRGAIAGLNAARSSIASADMTAGDRAEALAGIDEAQREMEAELRKGE